MGHNCERDGILSIKKEKDGVVGEPGFTIEQEVVEEGWTCELKHEMWLPSDWAKYISGFLLILGEVQMTVFPCLAGLIWENVV